jgi:WD40 repeat protein
MPGVTGADVVLSGWTDGALRAHDASTGAPLWEQPSAHPHCGITAICIVGGISAAPAQVSRHGANPNATTHRASQQQQQSGAAGGAVIVTAGADGELRTWDPRSRAMGTRVKRHGGAVLSMCAVPGRPGVVSTSSRDRSIVTSDLVTGQVLATHQAGLATLWGHTAIPAGGRGGVAGDAMLASIAQDGAIALWRAADRDRASRSIPNAHAGGATAIATARDGSVFATGGADGRVKVWDCGSGKLVADTAAHTAEVTSLAFLDDGSVIASTGKDGQVLVWARI